MATKPTLIPRLWASAGIYATGPFIGSISNSDPGVGIAGEGHRPGAAFPTAAEHENFQQLHLTTWVAEWLSMGSDAGAADAHIVETDAAGRSNLTGLTIVDTVDETAFSVTSANTVLPGSVFTCTTGAVVISVDMGNAAGTGVTANIGTGAGKGFSSTLIASASGAKGFVADLLGAAFGAWGIDVSADATTNGGGIRSSHAGGYYAMEAISTGVIAALNVTATAASTTAAFIAGGLTRALSVTSGSTAGADAIHATTANATGFGVRAFVAAGASSAARGFFTSVTDSAIGAEFIAAGNHALSITGDTTSPVLGALKITECNAIPTSILPNQIAIVRQTPLVATQLMESCLEDVGWRGFLSTSGGSALGVGFSAASITAFSSGLWYNALTFSANGGDAPKTAGGSVLMRINLTPRCTVASGVGVLNVQLLDDTAGGSVVFVRSGAGAGASAGYSMPTSTSTGHNLPINIYALIVVPVAGPRTWTLQIGRTGGDTISARDFSVDFLGMV